MSRIFVYEFKRAMNPQVIVAVIGVVFCICFDSWNDLIQAINNSGTDSSVHYFMWNSAFGGMCRSYILPVFATLPFAASFCEERNSNSVAFIVSREGMRRYSAVKYSINVIAGGITVALGTLLLLIFLYTKFQMVSDYETSGTTDLFHKWLAVNNPFQYCLTETALGFMRGMIWAGVAMFVSFYIADKLVITMFPFLGSYVFVRISQILSIDNGYRFDFILSGRTVIKNSAYTLLIAAVISVVLVSVIGFVFTKKMVRGLKDGTLYESR